MVATNQGETPFLFQDLDPGRYVIGASRNWATEPVAHRVLDVEDARVICELVLPPIERARRVRVSVFAPDGSALGGVKFHLRYSLGADHRFLGVDVTEGTGGAHLLRFEPEFERLYFESFDPGAYFDLDITHPDYCANRVELDAGQTELSATLVEPAQLEVTVSGWGDRRVLERMSFDVKRLRPEHEPAGPSTRIERPTQFDGVWTFSRLRPGKHRVTLELRPAGSMLMVVRPSSLATVELELHPGPNELEVTAPELGTLELRALRVEITDEQGHLAELGFVHGDLIVGANGVEFSRSATEELGALLKKKETCTPFLLVEREGARLEVRYELARKLPGGVFVPTRR